MSKKIKNCFDELLTFDNLLNAYSRAIKGKGNKKKNILFYMDLEKNIYSIYNDLKNGTYCNESYNKFIIYEPKERMIKSLPFRDRVVQQWYIYEFIMPFIVKRFIFDSYACINNKGNHKAVNKVQYFMRKMKRKYNNYYIMKFDIKKFFYNVDKDILFHIMKKYISDKKLLWLTSIFIYDGENREMAIGNYTSQYFANIYLNEFDYFIKYELGIECYVRFMDDFIILVKDKDDCKVIYDKVKCFFKNKLNLELNNRSRYYPNKFGVDFCGYRIYEGYRLIRKRCVRKIKRNIIKWTKLSINNKLDKDKMYRSINSFISHLSHCNSYNFRKKVLINLK